MSGQASELLTVGEVADRLKFHPFSVYRLIGQRRLGHIKLGPSKNSPVRVLEGDLQEFLRVRKVPAISPAGRLRKLEGKT